MALYSSLPRVRNFMGMACSGDNVLVVGIWENRKGGERRESSLNFRE